MVLQRLAAASRTTALRTSVVLLAISVSFLCGLYLLRVTDLRIVTDDAGRQDGPFHAPPPFHDQLTTVEGGKGKSVTAIEFISSTKEASIMENVFNRTLGVRAWIYDSSLWL